MKKIGSFSDAVKYSRRQAEGYGVTHYAVWLGETANNWWVTDIMPIRFSGWVEIRPDGEVEDVSFQSDCSQPLRTPLKVVYESYLSGHDKPLCSVQDYGECLDLTCKAVSRTGAYAIIYRWVTGGKLEEVRIVNP